MSGELTCCEKPPKVNFYIEKQKLGLVRKKKTVIEYLFYVENMRPYNVLSCACVYNNGHAHATMTNEVSHNRDRLAFIILKYFIKLRVPTKM